MLRPELVKRLVDRWDHPTIVAMALTGSHARGDAVARSDVDLWRFARDLQEKQLAVEVHDDHLISITTTTIEACRRELLLPAKAIWAVTGLRQARVLVDRGGVLQGLIQQARDFRWEQLEDSARAYASRTLAELAEEAQKVMSGLSRGDHGRAAYGTLGLFLGLTEVMAVSKGVLIETENSYFEQVQDAVGICSPWTLQHRLAGGLRETPGQTVESRGLAALALYLLTADQMSPASPEDARVIAWVRDSIRAFLGAGPGVPCEGTAAR
ncbi:MAG: nucleotidyltransferase domain-containing protein [Bacillota bacterium]